MAVLTAKQTFESMIPSAEDRVKILKSELDIDLYQTIFSAAESWCKDSLRRTGLRFIDANELPFAVRQAVQVTQRQYQPTAFKKFASYADTTPLKSFVATTPPPVLDIGQEFDNILHCTEVRNRDRHFKVLSAPSAKIVFARGIAKDSIFVVESGIEFALSYSVPEEIVALAFRWITETKSYGFESALQALAQLDRWYGEVFGQGAFYLHMDTPSKNIDRVKIALTSLQYQGYKLPSINKFRDGLAAEPFLHCSEFIRRGEGDWTRRFSEVRVGDIISALPSDDGKSRGWDFRDRGDEYVYNMAAAIIEGRFAAFRPPTYREYWNDPDIVLEKNGDKFAITVNGRHRVAALKGIDPELRVWAEVYEPK